MLWPFEALLRPGFSVHAHAHFSMVHNGRSDALCLLGLTPPKADTVKGHCNLLITVHKT